MRTPRALPLLLALLALPAHAAERVEASHAAVSLLAEGPAQPGEALSLGLRFELEPEWHVYWINPGDSGEPPKIKALDLPEGWRAEGIQWPLPERVQTGPVINFAYSGEILLPFAVQIPADQAPGEYAISAEVTWLVCKEDCIPGKATLSQTVTVQPAGSPPPGGASELAQAFAAARASLPWGGPEGADSRPGRGDAHFSREGDAITLAVRAPGLPTAALERFRFTFLPLQPGWLDLSAPQAARYDPEAGRLWFTLKAGMMMPEAPEALTGLVVAEGGDRRKGYMVKAAPGDVSALVGAPPPGAPSKTSGEAPGGGEAPISLWLALGLAALGGLILNLMPCVFPVLSLKIMGFVQQAHGDPKLIRRHGLAFAGGVLVSFWALAALLLALKASGAAVGWGFQLQSPAFVFGLTALLWALGLSQSGVYEAGLGLTRLGGHQGHGVWGSALTGMLATVVATPCTAPFMGPALGYGLTASAGEALAVFTALGLGMASPYIALSWRPGLLKRLPKPGAWMEGFKQLMAFPLYGTALWLMWVFGTQQGHDLLFEALLGLLVLTMGLWAWGRLQRRGSARWLTHLLAGILVLGGVALGVQAGAPPSPQEGVELWRPWSPETLASLRSEEAPVFVNFTADWCLSCKVNEKVVFDTDPIRDAFSDRGIIALKADWTRKDEHIAAALAAHGREGVPLYLYYAPGAEAPVILPQILTAETVLGLTAP